MKSVLALSSMICLGAIVCGFGCGEEKKPSPAEGRNQWRQIWNWQPMSVKGSTVLPFKGSGGSRANVEAVFGLRVQVGHNGVPSINDRFLRCLGVWVMYRASQWLESGEAPHAYTFAVKEGQRPPSTEQWMPEGAGRFYGSQSLNLYDADGGVVGKLTGRERGELMPLRPDTWPSYVRLLAEDAELGPLFQAIISAEALTTTESRSSEAP